MENISRKLTATAIAIISVFLLVGCAPANPMDAPLVSTETPSPAPSVLPSVTLALPRNTPTSQPTDQPFGPDSVSNYPLIGPDNLANLVFLEARPLDSGIANLNFSIFDWSRDGALIVTCSYTTNSSSYQVFDLIRGSLLSEIQIGEDFCESPSFGRDELKFSRDGGLFLGITRSAYSISVIGDSDITIYDSITGDSVSTLEGLSRPPEEVLWLDLAAFSSQGTRLALAVVEDSRPVSTEAASVQGGAWTKPYRSIELYDVISGDHWGSFLKQPFWFISDLEYSTEGEYLVIGSDEFTEAWHVEGEMTDKVACPQARITFSPVEETAALNCVPYEGDPYHLLWNLESGDFIQIADTSGYFSNEMIFSPDGQLLIGLSDDGEVSIWSAESGEILATLPDTYPTAVGVNFIWGGKLVAVLLDEGHLNLFAVK